MCVKSLAPGCSGVGEQDINMIGCLRYILHQAFDAFDLGAVRRYRYRLSAGSFVGKRIQRSAGSFACGGFAGCDVNFRTTSLKEPEIGR